MRATSLTERTRVAVLLGALALWNVALAAPTEDDNRQAPAPTYEDCIAAGANQAFCGQFPRNAVPPAAPGIGTGRLTLEGGVSLLVDQAIPSVVIPPMQLRPGGVSICGTDACEGECGQEGCEDIPIVDVLYAGTPLAILHPAYDYNAGSYTTNIGGIEVLSPSYLTSNGLGVGSSIGDVFGRCSGVEAWYSYISGDFTLRCPSLDRIVFVFARAGFVGSDQILGMSDGDRLPQSDLDMNARVIKVTVY